MICGAQMNQKVNRCRHRRMHKRLRNLLLQWLKEKMNGMPAYGDLRNRHYRLILNERDFKFAFFFFLLFNSLRVKVVCGVFFRENYMIYLWPCINKNWHTNISSMHISYILRVGKNIHDFDIKKGPTKTKKPNNNKKLNEKKINKNEKPLENFTTTRHY